jgi:hypothetical protein
VFVSVQGTFTARYPDLSTATGYTLPEVVVAAAESTVKAV